MKKSYLKKVASLAMTAVLCLAATGCTVSTSNQGGTPKSSSSTGSSASASTSADKSDTASVDYPTKPITLIVPYAAGGTTDIYGRLLAAQMEKQLGQSITVTNQGGASGSIGSKFVRDAASDGYTLLMCAETMGTYRTMGTSELSYNDFTAITPVVGDPKVIVVAKDSKYNTLQDLLDDIKANPNKITMSHSGPGGSGHNQGLVLKELGYEVSMTSFESGNAALLGVLGGQVDFTNPNISSLGSYIESGEVKALAVFASERMESYPDIPAFTETIPDAEKYLDIPYTALSLLVNNDTPEEIVTVLKDAANAAFAEPEWQEFVKQNAAEKLYEKYTTPEEMKAFYERWESIVCWLQFDNGVAQISPEEFGIKKAAE